jgi:hypothetical protein
MLEHDLDICFALGERSPVFETIGIGLSSKKVMAESLNALLFVVMPRLRKNVQPAESGMASYHHGGAYQLNLRLRQHSAILRGVPDATRTCRPIMYDLDASAVG